MSSMMNGIEEDWFDNCVTSSDEGLYPGCPKVCYEECEFCGNNPHKER
jgi:hypothetical protein